MDDKYYCKVGELGYFVVVVDRGKCVVVVEDKVFVVFDYDFIKFSVVLSVIMLVDIFEFIEEGLFYRGQVYVGVKDLVFEFFLLLWYIVELKQILLNFLNLVFQVVGLMRLEVLDECEKKLCLVGGLGQFREVVKDFVMW